MKEENNSECEAPQLIDVGHVTTGVARFSLVGNAAEKILSKVLQMSLKAGSDSAASPNSRFFESFMAAKVVQKARKSSVCSRPADPWVSDQLLSVHIDDVRKLRFSSEGKTCDGLPNSVTGSNNVNEVLKYEDIEYPSSTAADSDLWNAADRLRYQCSYEIDDCYHKRIKAASLSEVGRTVVASSSEVKRKKTDEQWTLSSPSNGTAKEAATSNVSLSEQFVTPVVLIRKLHGSSDETNCAYWSPPMSGRNTHGSSSTKVNDQHHHNQQLSGWDIVLPIGGVARNVWTALILAGARAVGQEEGVEKLALERQERAFPRDFPDTFAGQEYWQLMEEQEHEVVNRLPKNKRQFRNHFEKKVANVFGDSTGSDLHSAINWNSLPFEQDEDIHNDNESNSCGSSDDDVYKEEGQKDHPSRFPDLVVVRGGDYVNAFLPQCVDDEDLTDVVKFQFKSGVELCYPLSLSHVPYNTLVTVLLKPTSRGIPNTGATIYAASADDYKQFWSYSPNSKGQKVEDNIVHGGAWRGEDITHSDSSLVKASDLTSSGSADAGGSTSSGAQAPRQLLGFITSGGVSNTHNYSISIGHCETAVLYRSFISNIEHIVGPVAEDPANVKPIVFLVMFRNKNSPWFRPATLRIMY